MFAKSVLITGCNRGIGLEFVKQLAPLTEHLFATCRTPSQADELKAIANEHKHVVILELDVLQEEAIAKVISQVSEIVGGNGLNCLINNAGVTDKSDRCIENVTAEGLKRLYNVNAVAPAMMTKACLPLLHKASSLVSDDKMSVSRAAILNITSVLGSIADESFTGKSYSYRISKVALNMLGKNLSVELKPDNILATNIHPGWVLTDMGGPNAPITTQKSVESMMKLVSNFTEKDSGMFYSWDGTIIPW